MTKQKTLWDPIVSLQTTELSRRSILLSASAGTGKTTTIVNLIQHLLKQGTPAKNIMFVAFNAKIANEFKEKMRVAGLVQSKDDLRFVTTWHGLGRRLAQAQGILPKGKVARLDTPKRLGTLSKSALTSFCQEYRHRDQRYTAKIIAAITKKTVESRPLLAHEQLIYDQLLQYQKSHGCIMFLSMLRELLTKTLFDDEITHIFVDEAQDIGRGHYDYLLRVTTPTSQRPTPPKILLVGDEKQEVNQFMGADASCFVQYPAEYKATLIKTFRLPEKILHYANSIFLRSDPGSYVGMTQETAVEHEGELIEASFIDLLPRVRDDLSKGHSVIALARHHKTLHQMSEMFTARGIPNILHSSDSNQKVLVSKEHLEFAKEVYHARHTKNISPRLLELLNPLRGPGETGLLNIRKKKNAPYVNHPRREQFSREQRELLSAQRSFLFDIPDELDLTDGIAFEDTLSLERAGLQQRFVTDLMKDTFDWEFFTSKQEAYITAFEWVRRLGPGFAPIDLYSIHASKGLEADTVILSTETYGASQRAESAAPDIERRVWYVACTRARHSLYLASLPGQQYRTTSLPRLA